MKYHASMMSMVLAIGVGALTEMIVVYTTAVQGPSVQTASQHIEHALPSPI